MCLPILGAVISGIGAVVGGVMQAQAANQQAAAYERQAALERQQAEFNAGRQQDKAIALLSRQRASYLAAGVSLDGTPTDIIEDTTRESELDVAAIKYNGEIKAQNFEMQASAFRAKADAAMVGGIFGGIAPVIKGFGGDSGFSPIFGAGTNVEDA